MLLDQASTQNIYKSWVTGDPMHTGDILPQTWRSELMQPRNLWKTCNFVLCKHLLCSFLNVLIYFIHVLTDAHKAESSREKAVILCDYNISTTTTADKLFHFIDCEDTNFRDLARNLRAGVIEIPHYKVIIALGNNATLDHHTNVSTSVNAVINSLMDRYGCTGVRICVLGLLPRPGLDQGEEAVLVEQNKAIFKNVRAMIRRWQFPVEYLAAHKWLLRRYVYRDGSEKIQPIPEYFYPGTRHLNAHGMEHMYILLAGHLDLMPQVEYTWSEMPVVIQSKRKAGRKVFGNLSNNRDIPAANRKQEDDEGRKRRKRGRKRYCPPGNVGRSPEVRRKQDEDEDDEEPPLLVDIPGLQVRSG